ncbi:nucleotidyltransferase family protein [Devosia rhodophyticola]|uniref:Nucleotidyltransferase family protein n=1 Tax=Devosia rhodophyticola TaxID=3026423 RepID=A0ABY7YTA7_9HYPH|nr:nucleotidyltransferase family protein [Devosia rhodophyticola]WDR04486.1 nucleotidyltransferase family protein [Devosia rhodophyticola]
MVIKRAQHQFTSIDVPVEVRNQARVHLWFPQKFGIAYPELGSSVDMLTYFSTRAYAVAVQLKIDGELTIEAPFGLDDMFSFRLAPNLALDNCATHEAKARRAMAIWPELVFEPWPSVPELEARQRR